MPTTDYINRDYDETFQAYEERRAITADLEHAATILRDIKDARFRLDGEPEEEPGPHNVPPLGPRYLEIYADPMLTHLVARVHTEVQHTGHLLGWNSPTALRSEIHRLLPRMAIAGTALAHIRLLEPGTNMITAVVYV
jgi:hypothetical protein